MTKDYNKQMSGRTYLYLAKEYAVTQVVHVEDDLFDVFYEGSKTAKRVNESVLKKEFLPVYNGNASLEIYKAMEDNLPVKSLITTLTDTIEKVKSDPKYIDQARAINETAKTAIELGKLQVEMVRVAKGLS